MQLPAATLLNATYPAVHIGGARGRELQHALARCLMGSDGLDRVARALDIFWMQQHATFLAPDPVVHDAVNALVDSNGECTIAVVVRTVGCSDRTLLRRFRAATGLTPK